MNTSDKDNARLTAYALGELDDAQRAEVEARLGRDPEARRIVEQTRRAAGLLAEQLAKEPAAALKPQHRAAVRAAAKAAPRKSPWPRRLILWVPVSAAACLLIGVCMAWFGQGQGDRYSQSSDAAFESEKVFDAIREVVSKDMLGDDADGPVCCLEPMSPRSRMLWDDLPATGLAGIEDAYGLPTTQPPEGWNREAYDYVVDNPFVRVTEQPLSTFSIDVDTASYANIRRLLTQGALPPKGAVRIEEMVNYFTYDYAPPGEEDEHPFAVYADVAQCPWTPKHRLLRVAIKGREIAAENRPPSNFVFLLDVSGSMQPANKLPLLKRAMRMLVQQLGDSDRVAIAVYAGASGLVLDSTSCDRKETILAALDRLDAGGSTNGGAGIQLAYAVAAAHFIKDGVNRVILCTDGDFNVGLTSQSELVTLIEAQAKTGVYLSVLGFGMGNYQDSRLEKLADKGNGNYAYIDTIHEARKVLVEQMTGTLVTIAKDVKIQIEFNPTQVAGYRLIGYENRVLAKEDFNDDRKDAGEIGAGHTVTALYELVPAGGEVPAAAVDALKYQTTVQPTPAAATDELLTLKLRYKRPDEDTSTLISRPVRDREAAFGAMSADFRFAAAVASFGMILRDSKHKGAFTLDAVVEQADSARGDDPHGYRAEFVKLVQIAGALRGQR